MWKFLKKLLGFLLNLANRGAHRRTDFYMLKDRLLKQHGTFLCTDVQHVKKLCWTCQGSGYADGQLCWHCRDGVYDEFWTLLDKYGIGGYTFHLPRNKLGYDPRQGELFEEDAISVYGEAIEGYITHDKPKYHLGEEAFWWLMWWFEPEYFMHYILRSGTYTGRIFTPMVRIAHSISWCRYRWFDFKDFLSYRCSCGKLARVMWWNIGKHQHCIEDIPF
jgi:hypothetical protein